MAFRPPFFERFLVSSPADSHALAFPLMMKCRARRYGGCSIAPGYRGALSDDAGFIIGASGAHGESSPP